MIAAPTEGESGNECVPAILLRVKSYRFPLPVNIGELQATDLSGANAVDGKQHQNCVIADGDGAIAGRASTISCTTSQVGPAGSVSCLNTRGAMIEPRYRPGTNLAFRRIERMTGGMKRSLEC